MLLHKLIMVIHGQQQLLANKDTKVVMENSVLLIHKKMVLTSKKKPMPMEHVVDPIHMLIHQVKNVQSHTQLAKMDSLHLVMTFQ
uniref:CSON005286 protein n=1 Tax=Culicoides sonorensis TaxID=179676 RepID=A0A336N2R8_CULSO